MYSEGPTGSTFGALGERARAEVSSENADWVSPYTFSVVYQDAGEASAASLIGSTVQVQPPSGSAISAEAISTQVLGTTDLEGDGTTIIVTYQFVPPGGLYAALPGTYTI